ncbi:MAG: hypothetical protein AAGA80_15035 [Cyanobacteria bacterium P01_F01_bin.143]
MIEQLVTTGILQGSNPNLDHVSKYLKNSGDSYCQSVANILRSKPEERSENAPHDQELILMGIIKRSSERRLVIRNKIYEKALDKFFDEYQLQDRT